MAKKRKFSRKAAVDWLDMLCKTCVKVRDNFTCQIQIIECDHIKCNGCSGRMAQGDFDCQWCHIKSARRYHSRWLPFNSLCLCGHCHSWAHDNPVEFGVWFAEKYPERDVLLRIPREAKTWREVDFNNMERTLLLWAVELEVKAYHFPQSYRKRFKIRIEKV